jgi:hypothetical protein
MVATWIDGEVFVSPTIRVETSVTGAMLWRLAGFLAGVNGTTVRSEAVHIVEATEDGVRLMRWHAFFPQAAQVNATPMVERLEEVIDGINANTVVPFINNVADNAIFRYCGCGARSCTDRTKPELTKVLLEELQLSSYHRITPVRMYASGRYVCTVEDTLMRFKNGAESVVLDALVCYTFDSEFMITEMRDYRNMWTRGAPRGRVN